MQDRWDTELGKVNSSSDDFAAKQNAEVDRMHKRWDDEVRRSDIGSFAPTAQTEEEMLSQVEQLGELEGHVAEFNEPGSAVDEFTPGELLKLHLSRSRQARVIDERYRANDTALPNDQAGARRWVKNPAKTDIEGIDTPRGAPYATDSIV
jgi:hypothetical protein